jgi:D-alanyl-D-alanine carboxypeptidase
MKTKGILIVAMLLLVWSCKKNNPADHTDYTQQLQYALDTTWASFVSQVPQVNGGLGVYIVCPQGSYFVSKNLDEGAGPDAHFRAASLTKTLTATAIMLLDQDGKLRIDDTISHLIPGTSQPYLPDDSCYQIPYKDLITIRQLLDHRANVFDQVNSVVPATVDAWYAGQVYSLAVITQVDRYHQFSLDELGYLISHHQLTYGPPGTEYHYSNGNYTLLAKIIERVSGKSCQNFIHDEILTKNDLSETYIPYLGTDTTLAAPYLHGYLYINDFNIDVTNFNMSWAMGEGNMVSNFRDLAEFFSRLISGKSGLNMQQVSRMTECPISNESYGLGIEYFEGLGYGHTGSHLGYLTIAVYDPETDWMVVSESTLYPNDHTLNMAEAKAIVAMLHKMKQTVGY